MNKGGHTIETLMEANGISSAYQYQLNEKVRGLLISCELCECVVPVRKADDAFICRVCDNAFGPDLAPIIRAVRHGADISQERFWVRLANNIIDELTARKYRPIELLQSVVDEQLQEKNRNENRETP